MAEPEGNVATAEQGCTIIEGRTGCDNAEIDCIINGIYWDHPENYYVHDIGEGSITIKLAQPYMLSSIGFRLWDGDVRWYHYYVETSPDGDQWERVADKTEVQCSSWQYLEFERRPVEYIRLVGTGTCRESNKWFHVVHIEAPVSHVPDREPNPYDSDDCESCDITQLKGFASPRRVEVVGRPRARSSQFTCNFKSWWKTIFHFNPRFEENCVVMNNKHRKWHREERSYMPFSHGTLFVLEFIAINDAILRLL
ncbi:hypothetical protein QR680_014459 [Steinernema hermaphroditum]|uniref:Galectin n=1 Tax=Steinernema hermaphroditum TaxID=289476 RepID=A0AA39I8Y1_9BILA|nr:hypothetical protein QR680_014459 [Steinernema hermaphroditum]